MKANTPEKIYVSIHSGIHHYEQKNDDDIEYTRTDAFVEKACDAYCKVCGHYPHTTPVHICRKACDYYEDFKRAMEGE